jgi:hypothetical protein
MCNGYGFMERQKLVLNFGHSEVFDIFSEVFGHVF